MLMPFSNFLEKLNSASKHYFVFVCLLLSSHPGTRTGTQSKFRFSFLLLFASFFFLFHFITCGYPKGFCDGFQCSNVSLAHFALTEIGSSASELTARYQNNIVRCCRRVPELCIHSRIPVREPWERSCHAHILCESINTC